VVGLFPTCDVGTCISFPTCIYLTSTHNDKQGWKLKRRKIIYRTWHKQHDCWWSPIVIKICTFIKTSFENHFVYNLTMKTFIHFSLCLVQANCFLFTTHHGRLIFQEKMQQVGCFFHGVGVLLFWWWFLIILSSRALNS